MMEHHEGKNNHFAKMIMETCPECSGSITINKGNNTCSRCGLIVASCNISDELTYDANLDHAPLWSDIKSIEIHNQEWRNAHRDHYRLTQRINERFKKKLESGFYHCLKCGLPVPNHSKNHICNFNPIRSADWHELVCQLILSGKTADEIAGQLGKKIKAVQAVLYNKKNHLPRGIGSGKTKCKKCRAIISSLHGKKTHECGIPEEEKHEPIIDANTPCYLSYLDCCSGKYKKHLAISGKSISRELGIQYFNSKRYPNSILSQLNDPCRFIVCCSHHAEQIKTLREHHKWSFNEIIRLIENHEFKW